MSDRLKPWQPLPQAACDRCPAQAVRRVVSGDNDIEVWADENGVGHVGRIDTTIAVAALACEDHALVIGREYCDEYGWSNSDLLKESWRYWWIRIRYRAYGRHLDRFRRPA